MIKLAIKRYHLNRSPNSLQRRPTPSRNKESKFATSRIGLEAPLITENSIMKQILTTFLTLFLLTPYLHPAEKEKKEEEKSYLDRLKKAYEEKVESGKKLYVENVEDGKKLYEKNFGDGKELTEQTKEWVKEDIENIGDWEYKIVAFGSKASTEMEKELNRLGKERWQCFWVEPSGKEKVFYFKRTKKSYIQKIPAGDLLRIIGALNLE